MRVIENAPMGQYTSFKTGGNAERLVICQSMEDLRQVAEEVRNKGLDHIFLGNGSNTLFLDGTFPGTVIMLGEEMGHVSVEDKTLRCGASALLSKAARTAADAGLTGMEFASGIPGSIGGGLFMNAGAYGGELKDIVQTALVYGWKDDAVRTVPVEDMDLGYRHSVFQGGEDVILEVTFGLEEGDPEEIRHTMADLNKRRNDKQPVNYPSAGSFFKRPEGHFAGKLIEDAGLKGMMVGGAQVSDKHAGFVINKANATAEDIVRLMHLVQNMVYDRFQVMLEPEVRIVGNGSEKL